jgi:hypothetical protein
LAAGEELAGHESRFVKIETDLAVIKWMLGFLMAGVVSLVIKAFAQLIIGPRPSGRIAARHPRSITYPSG